MEKPQCVLRARAFLAGSPEQTAVFSVQNQCQTLSLATALSGFRTRFSKNVTWSVSPIAELPGIPINDPTRVYAELQAETERAVLDVLASGQYILGKTVEDLETDFCSYLGTTNAVGVSSGTEALLLALGALDVGPGDEVVTSAFSFIASGTCIARSGARPVFVDIDPDTYQMDPGGLAAAITPRTRAIIAVHLYGHPAPMDKYLEIASGAAEEPIAIVEDAAQAIGTVCRIGREGRSMKAGTIGLWGCFSFYPTKNLPACGEAGLMVTGQPNQAERARRLRVHGMDDQYHHVHLGGNARIDAIQAAILRVRLRHIERWNESRRENAAKYDALLTQNGLSDLQLPPPVRDGEVANYHQYTIRARNRDRLRGTLADKGISTGVYYPLALPLQPVFSHLGYREKDFPHASRACREVLSLPIHQHLAPGDVERVASEIVEFYRR